MHIMKDYTKDTTIIVSNTYRRQEQAIHPHELGGISWFCKEDKLIVIIIVIIIIK